MAAAAQAAGAGISAIGSIAQGNENANTADYNAAIANQNAQQVQAQGAEAARRSLVNSNKMMGAEQAAYGASGVSMSGSALDVLRASASQGELNALTIKNQADVKATAYANEAALDQYRGSNQRIAGYLSAASALTGAAGKNMGGGSPDSEGDAGEEENEVGEYGAP